MAKNHFIKILFNLITMIYLLEGKKNKNNVKVNYIELDYDVFGVKTDLNKRY